MKKRKTYLDFSALKTNPVLLSNTGYFGEEQPFAFCFTDTCSLDLFASNEPLSLVIAELLATASATTFSLKAKLYEERKAFGMIGYDNFEREGLFETGL